MSSTKEIHSPADLTARETKPFFGGMQALQQAAMKIADLRRGNSAFKTMDLVNVLLGNQAAPSGRKDILEQLERGEITVQEATQLFQCSLHSHSRSILR